MNPSNEPWHELEVAKRRGILFLAAFMLVAGTVNVAVAVHMAEPSWVMAGVVIGAGVAVALLRRGYSDAALAVQVVLSFATVGHTHVTVEAGDTAPYYLVPVVLMALLFLPGRTHLVALGLAVAGAVGMRLASPFDDPHAASHTVDLVVVMVVSAVVMWRGRVGWESSHGALSRAMAQLEAAEQEQRRLREAAEASSRAKSRFLANMSHELRTPLNAVIGYAEMLAESDLHAECLEDAERIHSAGTHLLGLVDDVLDLARVESGGRSVVASAFDLSELGAEIAQWLQPVLRDRGNHLLVDLPAVVITSDRLMVRQILLNLLGNANKFCHRGTIRLGGRLAEPMVELTVEDDGIGMTVEEQHRVLQPFVQAHDGILAEYGGTGLGLSIVDRFSRRLGGTVELTSTKGVGTTFTVRLPALR
ncbi:MAG: ATP-binding protein [Myxococcota bacterium]